MREILFRGKRIDNGEWVDGFYVCLNGKEHRIYSGYAETDCGHYYPDCWTIDPKTVGQFTGLTDKNGKKIFDGDILKVKSLWKTEWNAEGVCEKKQTYWSVEHKNHSTEIGFFTYGIDRRWHKPLTWSRLYNAEAEVAGNIHDNPELLEVAADGK